MNNKQIIEWNISRSKEEIKKQILKDRIIIFFTRLVEDAGKYQNPNFYGRIKEIYNLIYPYSGLEDPKEIFERMKKSDFKTRDGLVLNSEEAEAVEFFIKNLDSECQMKNKAKVKKELDVFLKKFVVKYLPNSSKIIEPYILGKLISSIGGISKIVRKPASTIQLIGAEKALFRHIAKGKDCPKYGLIYYSRKIKKAENKGNEARKLGNQLAINMRIDYFQHVKNLDDS
ncbi:hypothetical protein COV15_01000 [Candidatus Woesearchaeota archaeon CG10_big_fil_rev_8_21_14_0_10_34_12]|nr:MAG: hypothetical protein COV15_01000 [Candidatus Woesearchaeota archaeon CG10_big_fil_rev_8_21_14_0_10_34_12]